jgi:hypothetical protein
MSPEPLHIRFRADLLEPLAHFLLRGEPGEECRVTFAGNLASAERPGKGELSAWHGDQTVISRSATLRFSRQSLAAISTALLTRPDDVEPSEVFVDIRSSDRSPWLCEMRFDPLPDNPADAPIFHVVEIDPSLEPDDD